MIESLALYTLVVAFTVILKKWGRAGIGAGG
jgi:hypothetical protein